MPETKRREGVTQKFKIYSSVEGELEGYLTINCWDEEPKEVFLHAARIGSFVHGMLMSLAILISDSLQNGMPLFELCKSLAGVRFEPRGATNDLNVPEVTSLTDYIAAKLAEYLPADQHEEINKRRTKARENFII